MKTYIFTITDADGTSRQIRVTATSVADARRRASSGGNLTPTETLGSPTIVDVGDPAEAGIENVTGGVSDAAINRALEGQTRGPANLPIGDQGLGMTDAAAALGGDQNVGDAQVYQDAYNQFTQAGRDAATADIMAKTAVQNRYAGKTLPPNFLDDDTLAMNFGDNFGTFSNITDPEPGPGIAPTPIPLEEVSPFAAYLRSLGDIYGEGYGPGQRSFGASRVQSSGAPYGFGSYYYPALFEALGRGGEIPTGTDIPKLLDPGAEDALAATPGFTDYLSEVGQAANPLFETRRRAGDVLSNLAGGNVPFSLQDYITGTRPTYIEGGDTFVPGQLTQDRKVTDALGSMARSALANQLGGFAYNWLSPMLQREDTLADEYYAGTSGMGGRFGEAQNLADYIRRGYGLQ